jgi:hypothetical protein
VPQWGDNCYNEAIMNIFFLACGTAEQMGRGFTFIFNKRFIFKKSSFL